jgi:hypothetical protein
MAIPTYEGAGAQANSATVDVTPALPTHVADDILVIDVELSGGDASFAVPSGWNEFPDSPQAVTGTGGTKLQKFWKRATSGAEAAPTFSISSKNHILARASVFRGCETSGNPSDVTAGGTNKASADTAVSAAGDTSTVADGLVVITVARGTDSSSTTQFDSWANADLANLTERWEAGTTDGNGGGLALVTGEKATAGAFGATTATLATTALQAIHTVVLKPAAGGGGGGFNAHAMMHQLQIAGGLV